MFDAGAYGSAFAAIDVMAQDDGVGMSSFLFFQYFGSAVGGVIVDQDELFVEVQGADPLENAFEEFFFIVYGYDNRNQHGHDPLFV
jgi:hypothetical protein